MLFGVDAPFADCGSECKSFRYRWRSTGVRSGGDSIANPIPKKPCEAESRKHHLMQGEISDSTNPED